MKEHYSSWRSNRWRTTSTSSRLRSLPIRSPWRLLKLLHGRCWMLCRRRTSDAPRPKGLSFTQIFEIDEQIQAGRSDSKGVGARFIAPNRHQPKQRKQAESLVEVIHSGHVILSDHHRGGF